MSCNRMDKRKAMSPGAKFVLGMFLGVLLIFLAVEGYQFYLRMTYKSLCSEVEKMEEHFPEKIGNGVQTRLLKKFADEDCIQSIEVSAKHTFHHGNANRLRKSGIDSWGSSIEILVYVDDAFDKWSGWKRYQLIQGLKDCYLDVIDETHKEDMPEEEELFKKLDYYYGQHTNRRIETSVKYPVPVVMTSAFAYQYFSDSNYDLIDSDKGYQVSKIENYISAHKFCPNFTEQVIIEHAPTPKPEKPTPTPTPKPKKKSGSGKGKIIIVNGSDDPYEVDLYDDPEDFWEDHEDEFEDFEDAWDYWEENQ